MYSVHTLVTHWIETSDDCIDTLCIASHTYLIISGTSSHLPTIRVLVVDIFEHAHCLQQNSGRLTPRKNMRNCPCPTDAYSTFITARSRVAPAAPFRYHGNFPQLLFATLKASIDLASPHPYIHIRLPDHRCLNKESRFPNTSSMSRFVPSLNVLVHHS